MCPDSIFKTYVWVMLAYLERIGVDLALSVQCRLCRGLQPVEYGRSSQSAAAISHDDHDLWNQGLVHVVIHNSKICHLCA